MRRVTQGFLLSFLAASSLSAERPSVEAELKAATILTDSARFAASQCFKQGRMYVIRIGTRSWLCLESAVGAGGNALDVREVLAGGV